MHSNGLFSNVAGYIHIMHNIVVKLKDVHLCMYVHTVRLLLANMQSQTVMYVGIAC